MELKEREDTKEFLDEAQKTDMFTAIVMGKDVTEKIKTSRGEFEVKYPRARDIQAIGRLQAYRLNGVPAESFDKNVLNFIQQVATLDVLVMNGPSWFENAKKENVNFTWLDIPSQAFIMEVYAALYTFRLKVQKLIESNGNEGNKGLDSVPDTKDNDGPGLFDGVSSE